MTSGMLFIVAGAMLVVGLALSFLTWAKVWQGAGPRQQAEQAGNDQEIAELAIEVIEDRRRLHARHAGILRALLYHSCSAFWWIGWSKFSAPCR